MSHFANLPPQWRTHWEALRQMVGPIPSGSLEAFADPQADYDTDDAPISIREEDPHLDAKLTRLFSEN